MVLRRQAGAEVTQIRARHDDIGVQAEQVTARDEDGPIAGIAGNTGAQLEGGEALAVLVDEIQHFVAGLPGKGFDRGFGNADTGAQRRELRNRQAVGQIAAEDIA